ncbi:hypothetical protein GIB67_030713 [Kingdonia uniflora]|uniref:SWIM-type domain-containing protein n=1 Tax=Kingdonia uniflora TaxID=39325 RepID=A0A7J7L301_9MAGN|nr:hypothetical protein GIB67_030713 [Kingdonia uniflora]
MNEVQLYTIVHFGGDIIRSKIGSIVTYVGGSTKLTSLRAHSSYEDFVTLLEETSEIRREDCKLYNFVHYCACAILSVQDFTEMINMLKTNPDTPFHIWIVNDLRVPSKNSQNFISDFCSSGKGLSTTKDTGSDKGLSTTKARGPLRHNSFPDPEPEYWGYPETNGRGLDPRRFGPFVDDENDFFETIHIDVPLSNEPSIPQSNVHLSNEPVLTIIPQSNKPFQTIPTKVPLSNEPSIPQSSIHLSNEPVLTNALPSNELTLTNVPLSIKPEPIIGQSETSDGTCSCRWWQTMGIPCEHGVRALGLANVDPTISVSEYYTNNTYKAVYEPIWIPIRGIELYKILKTDPRVRDPIPTVRAGHPLFEPSHRRHPSPLDIVYSICRDIGYANLPASLPTQTNRMEYLKRHG